MLMLTKANKNALPALYAQSELPANEAMCHVKFFGIGSAGAWTWYAMEFDGEDTFFGYVVGPYPELGYFSLAELTSLKWMGIPAVERDRNWSPRTLQQVKSEHMK